MQLDFQSRDWKVSRQQEIVSAVRTPAGSKNSNREHEPIDLTHFVLYHLDLRWFANLMCDPVGNIRLS